MLATADASLKETEKYPKAAARTEYKEEGERLTKFKAAAKKCAEDLGKVLAAEKSKRQVHDGCTEIPKGHEGL